MGYESPGYRFKWPEGHELHGLEIRSTGLSVDELEEVAAFRELRDAPEEERKKVIAPMVAMFADHLVEWNWTHGGEPVGTDEKSIRRLDSRQLIPVIFTWMREVSSIPAPLPQGLPSGQPSPVESPLMDLPSPNLTS